MYMLFSINHLPAMLVLDCKRSCFHVEVKSHALDYELAGVCHTRVSELNRNVGVRNICEQQPLTSQLQILRFFNVYCIFSPCAVTFAHFLPVPHCLLSRNTFIFVINQLLCSVPQGQSSVRVYCLRPLPNILRSIFSSSDNRNTSLLKTQTLFL